MPTRSDEVHGDRDGRRHGGDRLPNSVTQRRLLGAFYTPAPVAQLLTQWAIRPGCRSAIDPSFGGGVFLRAARDAFREHGQGSIHGVDVDPACVHRLATDLVRSSDIVVGDFIALPKRALPGSPPYDAVLGNPPYVRHHWMSEDTRQAAHRLAKNLGVPVRGTASLWVYFVLRSLQLLSSEGRFAMVLPEAVLQADYAAAVRQSLARRFKTVRLLHLRERLFEGTEESVVIALGEGEGPGSIHVDSATSVDELRALLWGEASESPRELVTAKGRRVARGASRMLERVLLRSEFSEFGRHASIRIGLVTGANPFFVRRRSELQDLGLDGDVCRPIIARTRWLEGAQFCAEDHASWAKRDAAAFLIRPDETQLERQEVANWVSLGKNAKLHLRHKCAIREHWAIVPLGQAPHAIATSARQGSPRLVVNAAGYSCTNALYSVRWNKRDPAHERSIVMGFHTAATSLWAELHGRRYGGGVLKLDPTALASAPVPVVEVGEAEFQRFDTLMRSEGEEAARTYADDVILVRSLGAAVEDVRALRAACSHLQAQRIPERR